MEGKDTAELLALVLERLEAIKGLIGVERRVADEPDPGSVEPLPVGSLQWTHSKTDLIELIYALHSAGAFNHGKCTIREIVAFFENTFNLRLGNTSMTFQEILRRKETTVFLDRLKTKLELHITRIDEKHLR